MKPESNLPRITLRDIANALGLSHATVSLSFKDSSRISSKTRQLVRQKAEEMGYRPDPMLSALCNYRKSQGHLPVTSALAWINAWPNPARLRTYREFNSYWEGASAAAERYGYRLEEFRFGGEFTPERLHQILSTRGIRGILLPPHQRHPDWKNFPWDEYSVVRFGRSLNTPRTHLVTADQATNTLLSFEKIRERGYRRIGFITDETDFRYHGHLFEGGYLTAQRLVEEKERLPVFVLNDYPVDQRKKPLGAWLKQYKPDAIITNRPEVPEMLKNIGVRIPEDIGLAGTTMIDIPVSAGIDQHPEEIGRVAFLMLNSLLNDGARGLPPIFRQNLVEGTWVDGDSLPDRTKK